MSPRLARREPSLTSHSTSTVRRLNYENDPDFFRFEAEAGRFYQIDGEAVAGLRSVTVFLHDGDRVWLATDTVPDRKRSSRIVRPASSDGPLYVEVSGYGSLCGRYTLTVTALDRFDDHSNAIRESSPLVVGETLAGALEYEGDLDHFAFELEAGRRYRIVVESDTLSDLAAMLYDSEGRQLDSIASRDGAVYVRIDWEAVTSGRYFVAVAGFGNRLGGYTLTVVKQLD